MKITDGLRATLVREIRFASENMAKSDKYNDKMYFFSAVYAVLDRCYNFEFDPELVFIYQISRQAFDTINGKLALMAQGGSSVGTTLPVLLFPKLEETLQKLAYAIEKDQPTQLILQTIANIGYSATGNGSYLIHKGMLKIEQL